MKKIGIIITTAFLVAAVLSCNKQETNNPTPSRNKVILTARIVQQDSPLSKTHLGEKDEERGYPILWTEGDKITAFTDAGLYAEYALKDGKNTQKGTFEGSPIEAKYAVYPSSALSKIEETTVTLNINTEQSISKGNSFAEGSMIMYSTYDESLSAFSFNPMLSALKLPIAKGAEIDRIVITDNDENPLSGIATFDCKSPENGLTFQEEGSADSVVLICDPPIATGPDSTNFFIALPPTVQDEEGYYSVKIYYNNRTQVINKNFLAEFIAGHVKPAPKIVPERYVTYTMKKLDGTGIISPIDSTAGGYIASFEQQAEGSTDYDRQVFIHFDEAFAEGQQYEISFLYMASRAIATLTQAHGEPGTYHHWDAIGTINFTTEEQQFLYSTTVTAEQAGEGGMKSIALIAGRADSASVTLTLRDITIKVK